MIDAQELWAYCLSRIGAEETFPFGPDAAVYKVLGKMFALIPQESQTVKISLKCHPDWARLLRDTYPAVQPGYHLNKRHWNTVISDGSIPDDELLEMIDHSYEQVVAGMTRAQRRQLRALGYTGPGADGR